MSDPRCGVCGERATNGTVLPGGWIEYRCQKHATPPAPGQLHKAILDPYQRLEFVPFMPACEPLRMDSFANPPAQECECPVCKWGPISCEEFAERMNGLGFHVTTEQELRAMARRPPDDRTDAEFMKWLKEGDAMDAKVGDLSKGVLEKANGWTFEDGAVVELKSGSTPMTVHASLRGRDGHEYVQVCYWNGVEACEVYDIKPVRELKLMRPPQ
jgi:hypothetical protein